MAQGRQQEKRSIPNVLTIAGIDPSGGAGVLADIKAMSALGAYGCAVVAALTAQNTCGVTGVMPVPPEFVTEQLDTLFSDVRIDAVKIGMLGDAGVIRAVADGLKRWKPRHVVLDPVMVATSGDRLLRKEAEEVLISELLPLSDLITPNIPEAEVLLGRGIPDSAAMKEAVSALKGLSGGSCAVLLKGGHFTGDESVDAFVDGSGTYLLQAPRFGTRNTHGTGCTLSAAVAALLPQRDSMLEAVRDAKTYLTGAIERSGELSCGSGRGHGPVHHFYRLWDGVAPFSGAEAAGRRGEKE